MSRILRSLAPSRTTPSLTRFYSSFGPRPSPPKLPAEQQAEFERLQRAAAVSSAFQPEEAPSAASGSATTPATSQLRHQTNPTQQPQQQQPNDVNQGLFRGAPPEFEGDVNPKTGEVGGPKNEPLRWGHEGDWSYNGRVTDF